MPPSESTGTQRAGRPGPDITELTGIRSSKPTFYIEYRHTAESLNRALRSLERIAGVLTVTRVGARGLCRDVLHAAQEHLGAQWTVLALVPDAIVEAEPRLLSLGPAGGTAESLEAAPAPIRAEVAAMLERRTEVSGVSDDGTMVVPMVVDGAVVGGLIVFFADRAPIEPADLAILRIRANQATIALHSDHLLTRSESLRRQTEEVYAKAEQRTAALAERHQQLADARARLEEAAQREAIDAERHRIARELHDSVAQHVLSAGMTIEWCRPEVEHHTEVYQRLDHAKQLTRQAVEQLRGAIHALSHNADDDDAYRATELSDDLVAVLHHLGVDRSPVFGYSFVGALAAWMAQHAPRTVTAAAVGGFPLLGDPTSPFATSRSRIGT